MPADVAQAGAIATRTTSTAAARRSTRASGDDIGPLRNLEREDGVGQPRVLPIVAELERGASSLLVGGGQRSDLHGLRVDPEHQPVVVALLLFGIEPQVPRAVAGRLG